MYCGTNFGSGGFGQLIGGRLQTASVTDTLAYTESVGVITSFKVALTDTLAYVETLISKIKTKTAIIDTLAYVESLSVVANFKVVVTDTIGYIVKLFGNWFVERIKNINVWTNRDKNKTQTEL